MVKQFITINANKAYNTDRDVHTPNSFYLNEFLSKIT